MKRLLFFTTVLVFSFFNCKGMNTSKENILCKIFVKNNTTVPMFVLFCKISFNSEDEKNYADAKIEPGGFFYSTEVIRENGFYISTKNTIPLDTENTGVKITKIKSDGIGIKIAETNKYFLVRDLV